MVFTDYKPRISWVGDCPVLFWELVCRLYSEASDAVEAQGLDGESLGNVLDKNTCLLDSPGGICQLQRLALIVGDQA